MEEKCFTEHFEQHRPHLRAVAHRMLGSASETDDALQEVWLRVRDQDVKTVQNPRAWLTAVVGRVCLNMLRSRRQRREDMSIHVLDPVLISEEKDPEHHGLLADSISSPAAPVDASATPPSLRETSPGNSRWSTRSSRPPATATSRHF